jgi:hypothetical protein
MSARKLHRVLPGRRLRCIAMAAAVPGSLALLAAGCGGGSPTPDVANLGSTTIAAGSSTPTATSSGAEAGGPQAAGGQAVGAGRFTMVGGSAASMMAFSSCMRSHGVPSFPDPSSQGAISISSASGIDPNSPQFQSAQGACQKLLPNGGAPSPAQQAQARTRALAFSACMRSHGVPNFPDPTFSGNGGISLRITAASGGGLDPGSPVFESAQKACASDLPGALGKAAPHAVGASGSSNGAVVAGG